ncbi:MAG: hypothetical protein QOI09_1658 [Chloroflexota bacterium]|jgi:hypothetical protein|nr:hypothetical protein [Chloroflexota bacterium]
MFTNEALVDRIEEAHRLAPYCEGCGSPTIVVEHDAALWLECSTLSHHQSRLRSFLTLAFARFHVRREIADLGPTA